MKQLHLKLTMFAIFIAFGAVAQQPFEKYGYKVKVLTLSQGKYEEFFDQDTLVQIGSVIMNSLTGKIHSFVEYDTMYSEATLEPEIISRWLSPDPMSDVLTSLSPYNYVENNPINMIDPDGLLSVFALDKESGDIKMIEENNDKTDDLVDSETGKKVSNNVDKGLLADGMNIKSNGLQTSNASGGVSLIRDISMHTNDEIGGTVYKNNEGGQYLDVPAYKATTVERNENGDVVQMTAGFSLPTGNGTFTSNDRSFTGKPQFQFHTHPGHPDGIGAIGTAIPSASDKAGALMSGIPQVIYGAKSATFAGGTGNKSTLFLRKFMGHTGKMITAGTVSIKVGNYTKRP